MREIGRRLKAEQNLTDDDIAWLVVIAKAVLRAFVWGEGQPMRILADDLGISPTTLYTMLRLAVQALMLVHRGKKSVEVLTDRIQELQKRLAQVEQACDAAQAEVQRLTKALSKVQTQAVKLQAEVTRLQAQWTVSQRRLITVLKLSGRCTVRSIIEVLEYGFGVQVSVGYVQGVIAEAGMNARPALERLWEVIPLSGAISIDEVFLKEMGRKMLGVVIVDPLSGLILRMQRCGERSKDAIGEVIKEFADAGFKEKVKLCLTDMYAGYLEPVKTHRFGFAHYKPF